MNEITVEKSVYRPVTCEKCGCAYGYRLSATATAVAKKAKGLEGTLQGGLQRLVEFDVPKNLQDDAYRRVYSKLNATHRFVACPKCRWYQRSMSRAYGMQKLAWMYYLGMPLFCVAGAAAFLAVMFLQSDTGTNDVMGGWIFAGAAILLAAGGVATFGIRNDRASRYDLNANYPNHVAPLPGEPDAIISRPANPYIHQGIDDDFVGWLVVRDGKQFGPHSWTYLYDLATDRKLLGTDYILAPNASEWAEARAFPDLNFQ